ncbi:IreB family regulatory phosphoprotein [Alicyclobacillus dauci]
MSNRDFDKTMRFETKSENTEARHAFQVAYRALKEKGYNPIYQIAGYLISGDPAYITSHLDARNTIRRIERDDLIEELVRAYAALHGDADAGN